MSHLIEFVYKRSLRPVPGKPAGLSYRERNDAEREAYWARIAKVFEIGDRVGVRIRTQQ